MNRDQERSLEVANIIKHQIGFWAFAEVGARDFGFGANSLVFTAKPLTRLVVVTITLDASDTYSMSVVQKSNGKGLYVAENIYADQVGEIVRGLASILGGK